MTPVESSILLTILPPAVALGVFVYLVRFFGRIIADQKPFTDDRDWEIELGGLTFMLILAQGVIGVGAAIYGPQASGSFLTHIVHLVVASAIFAAVSLASNELSQKYFRIKNDALEKLFGQDRDFAATFLGKLAKHWPYSIATIILFYIGAREIVIGDLLWTILALPIIFRTFMSMAFLYSIRKTEDRVGVDVYFIDDRPPLKDVMILKVNSDNIRLREGDTIMVVNRDQVLKFEFEMPEKYRPGE